MRPTSFVILRTIRLRPASQMVPVPRIPMRLNPRKCYLAVYVVAVSSVIVVPVTMVAMAVHVPPVKRILPSPILTVGFGLCGT